MHLDQPAFEETLSRARARLLASRAAAGHWAGELSSSALSTATAAFALHLVDPKVHRALIGRGLDWLGKNRNADGGWGDTVISKSNLSTTALCWAALAGADTAGRYSDAKAAAEAWIAREIGGLAPQRLAAALGNRYGKDRSFSAPILTMCALAGRLGACRGAWRWVRPLPFELAALPHRWLKWLRLPTVSYALPALIAIGQARYRHRPPANPLARLVRGLASPRAMTVLDAIQPPGGGFLEATPLTAFVVMALAGAGRRDHVVVTRGVGFLTRSARPDGSWPIDANLATWVTTLAVNALAAGTGFPDYLPAPQREAVRDWLLAQQRLREHPYTHAAPGGWAWTDLPGGVPDADDTAGALLALRHLDVTDGRLHPAAAGVRWLLDLQNRDGGIPTFCRGWGALPFDRSSPDLTAHALRAFCAWAEEIPAPLRRRAAKASQQALAYLKRAQRPDGSWVPLWFGNESATGEENATYGTARVILAVGAGGPGLRGVEWLLSTQQADGGWGGGAGAAPSIEETAVAVEALAGVLGHEPTGASREPLEAAVCRGVSWLVERTGRGAATAPSPIGLYFARLWYFAPLYPLIFTVSALGRVESLLRSPAAGRSCPNRGAAAKMN